MVGHRRSDFSLYVSPLVLREVVRGDAQAAAKRMQVIDTLPLLHITEQAEALAEVFVRQGLLPAKASADALHLAVTAVHGVEYLLTWNCKHIANASIRGRINSLCRAEGFEPPTICTPEELMDEELSGE